MVFDNFLNRLRHCPVDEGEDERVIPGGGGGSAAGTPTEPTELSSSMRVQADIAAIIQPFFASDGLIIKALDFAQTLDHIMDFTRLRALGSLFSMLNQAVRNVITYNQNHQDFPIQCDQLERYIPRALVYALVWSLTGDSRLKVRQDMGKSSFVIFSRLCWSEEMFCALD